MTTLLCFFFSFYLIKIFFFKIKFVEFYKRILDKILYSNTQIIMFVKYSNHAICCIIQMNKNTRIWNLWFEIFIIFEIVFFFTILISTYLDIQYLAKN